ncbi:universal stress protein [Halogeometricum borinquense]|uniref:Universal stress protein n=1 Tax=Halogeometricum borinquense TaxID=60847 RepID=A0A6C0UF17_9EURY|nr:universal stress protein [Halogeometricum borinquense]QIB73797.1 universal stress protein [Halogeometricum borinquense]QIQ76846.1 universal stress protein [Halogeometricum borinquense]
MYDRILVPTDGSDCANAAVDHAADLASKYDAEVHILYVVDVRVSGQGQWALDTETVYEAGQEHGQAVVEQVAEQLESKAVAVKPVVKTGVPGREIREYVDEEACDLVVMGTHGRTGLDRYLLGSVAERIVRTSDVPVLTVRSDE